MVSKQLGLHGDELDHIEGLFPRTVQYPIEASDSNRRNLESKLTQKYATNEFKLTTTLAGDLATYVQELSDSVRAFLDLDLFLTIGQFAQQFKLSTPNISKNSSCVSFSDGKNMYLLQEELQNKLKVAPVTYALGNSIAHPEGTNRERVTILSGANSGGKTTAIQLIAQISILAQSGFPVPAKDVELSLFDSILYFSKPSGTMDAGAF